MSDKFVVLERAQRSVGMWVWLSRVYLYKAQLNEAGAPIIPARIHDAHNDDRVIAFEEENTRATARFRDLVASYEARAAALNKQLAA
jgi:hypothetical protein